MCGDGIWYVQYIPCVYLWTNKGVGREKNSEKREMTMLLLLIVW